MYTMFFDNIDMRGSKFDCLILKLACPVRYPKRPFNYITGDIDKQLSNCSGFNFRLMGRTKQCQMGCLLTWHFYISEGNGRDVIR